MADRLLRAPVRPFQVGGCDGRNSTYGRTCPRQHLHCGPGPTQPVGLVIVSKKIYKKYRFQMPGF